MNSNNEKIILQNPAPNTQIQSTVKAAENTQIPNNHKSPIISISDRKKRFRFSLRPFIMPIVSLILAFCLISAYAEHLLETRFFELAKNQAEKYLLTTINSAVENLAAEGFLSYSSLVKTIRDSSGEVIYLEVDTTRLADATAKLVKQIDNALCNKKRITVSIPLGSLGGWNLFSGLGVPVRARIFPIGSTSGEIYTVLEDCGINQTRHLIQVNISAKLHLVLPRESTDVETKITLPLGERVLVGDVPEIYLDTLGGN